MMLSIRAKKEVYDQLYALGQDVVKLQNPCQISKDGKSCNGGKPCCGGCPHLSDKGCSIPDALACKLYLCHEVIAMPQHKEAVISMHMLRKTGMALGIPMGVRLTKEENFRGAPIPAHAIRW
jgi:hypothetical protein